MLVVAGLFTARWYFSDKAAPGVTLGRISVAGQNRDRLTDTVTRAIADSTLTVADPDGQEIKASLEELGVSVDVDATVDALLNAKTDGDATGVRALLSDFARLNPFSKADIGLSAEYDEYTANTFLTDRFVADDQQAVPSSTRRSSRTPNCRGSSRSASSAPCWCWLWPDCSPRVGISPTRPPPA